MPKYLTLGDASNDPLIGIAATEALRRWQFECFATLEAIRGQLLADEAPMPSTELAEVIATVARFNGEDDFITPELRALSQGRSVVYATFRTPAALTLFSDILSRVSPLLSTTRCDTAALVLSTHIKPLFLPTQHPMVNQQTGRKIVFQLGSRSVHPEFHDDQTWKADGKGCWNTLRWIVSQLQVRAIRYYDWEVCLIYIDLASETISKGFGHC